jgi:CubicO group peptidase (beta-lactamase class C family)
LFTLLFSAFALAAGGGDGLPVKTPRAVGMSAARLAKIDHVIMRGIQAGGYPGAAVVVGRKGAAVWERGFGRLSWTKDSPQVNPGESLFDLASLTKVVGTTTAIMILFDEGKVGLDDPVSRFIPQFAGGEKDLVTIRQLLEHRSGLPAGRDLWRLARTPEEARWAVIETPLAYHPGQYVEYSDLGADMLGFVVEAASGERLDQFLAHRVWEPLGMTDTFFKPADSLVSRIAPTEINPPRGYPLRGEVHDENAFALGGVAGHAGLFSSAADLAVFAQMMLNGGEYNGARIIADSTVALFTSRAVRTRALGWDTCGGDGSCGKYLSGRAYGHTGFTGTSLWIDPDRDMFVILLTNRVHAARARRPAKVIADVRADLSDAAALAVMDYGDGVLRMPSHFRADRAIGWNRPERTGKARSARSSRTTKSTRKHTTVSNGEVARSAKGKSASAAARKPSATKSSSSGSARAKTTTRPASTKSASARSRSTKSSTAKPATSKSAKAAPAKKRRG